MEWHQMSDLEWLLGRWIGRDGDGHTEAVWELAGEAALEGRGSTQVNGVIIHRERMRIERDGSRWVYRFMPEGRLEMRFDAVTVEDGTMVFQNVEDGFPHRIQYRRKGTSLMAIIEDDIGKRQMSWAWERSNTD